MKTCRGKAAPKKNRCLLYQAGCQQLKIIQQIHQEISADYTAADYFTGGHSGSVTEKFGTGILNSDN
jgi:hypothetical protein